MDLGQGFGFGFMLRAQIGNDTVRHGFPSIVNSPLYLQLQHTPTPTPCSPKNDISMPYAPIHFDIPFILNRHLCIPLHITCIQQPSYYLFNTGISASYLALLGPKAYRARLQQCTPIASSRLVSSPYYSIERSHNRLLSSRLISCRVSILLSFSFPHVCLINLTLFHFISLHSIMDYRCNA
ncbi:hypothetical protein BDR05DRAFT_515471 [Suillus weaverae]|nr:hypothetical protein BDR05DRAFT_515471 [Suillus weaverae]